MHYCTKQMKSQHKSMRRSNVSLTTAAFISFRKRSKAGARWASVGHATFEKMFFLVLTSQTPENGS